MCVRGADTLCCSGTLAAPIIVGDVVGTVGGGALTVGNTGVGSVVIHDSAETQTSNVSIGKTATGDGTVTVQNPFSAWNLTGSFEIGSNPSLGAPTAGTGRLNIENDGAVNVSGGNVGVGSNGGNGTIDISSGGDLAITQPTGTGSTAVLNIGFAGNTIPAGAPGTGSVTVRDEDSALTMSADTTLAYVGALGGTGSLTIENGGQFSATGATSVNMGIGQSFGLTGAGPGVGTLTVDGGLAGNATLSLVNTGTSAFSSAQLTVGQLNGSGGAGEVNVINGGTIEIDSAKTAYLSAAGRNLGDADIYVAGSTVTITADGGATANIGYSQFGTGPSIATMTLQGAAFNLITTGTQTSFLSIGSSSSDGGTGLVSVDGGSVAQIASDGFSSIAVRTKGGLPTSSLTVSGGSEVSVTGVTGASLGVADTFSSSGGTTSGSLLIDGGTISIDAGDTGASFHLGSSTGDGGNAAAQVVNGGVLNIEGSFAAAYINGEASGSSLIIDDGATMAMSGRSAAMTIGSSGQFAATEIGQGEVVIDGGALTMTGVGGVTPGGAFLTSIRVGDRTNAGGGGELSVINGGNIDINVDGAAELEIAAPLAADATMLVGDGSTVDVVAGSGAALRIGNDHIASVSGGPSVPNGVGNGSLLIDGGSMNLINTSGGTWQTVVQVGSAAGDGGEGTLEITNGGELSLSSTTTSFVTVTALAGQTANLTIDSGAAMSVNANGGTTFVVANAPPGAGATTGTVAVNNGSLTIESGSATSFVRIGSSFRDGGEGHFSVSNGGSVQVLSPAFVSTLVESKAGNLSTLSVESGSSFELLGGGGASLTVGVAPTDFIGSIFVANGPGTGAATVDGGTLSVINSNAVNSASLSIGSTSYDGAGGSMTVTGGGVLTVGSAGSAFATVSAKSGLTSSLAVAQGSAMDVVANGNANLSVGSASTTAAAGAANMTIDASEVRVSTNGAGQASGLSVGSTSSMGSNGSLALSNAGQLEVTSTAGNASLSLGAQNGGMATMSVASGSTFQVTGATAGATIAAANSSIGSVGSVVVNGGLFKIKGTQATTGATTNVTTFGIGSSQQMGGSGSLNIQNGGQVVIEAAGSTTTTIGALMSGSSSLTVGAGSSFTTTGNRGASLAVGQARTKVVGGVSVGDGLSQAAATVDGGTININTLTVPASPTAIFSSSLTVGSVTGDGALGTLDIVNGGAVSLTSASTTSVSVASKAGSSSALTIGSGSSLSQTSQHGANFTIGGVSILTSGGTFVPNGAGVGIANLNGGQINLTVNQALRPSGLAANAVVNVGLATADGSGGLLNINSGGGMNVNSAGTTLMQVTANAGSTAAVSLAGGASVTLMGATSSTARIGLNALAIGGTILAPTITPVGAGSGSVTVDDSSFTVAATGTGAAATLDVGTASATGGNGSLIVSNTGNVLVPGITIG